MLPQKIYIPALPTQPRTILSCHFPSSGDLGANHDCGNAGVLWEINTPAVERAPHPPSHCLRWAFLQFLLSWLWAQSGHHGCRRQGQGVCRVRIQSNPVYAARRRGGSAIGFPWGTASAFLQDTSWKAEVALFSDFGKRWVYSAADSFGSLADYQFGSRFELFFLFGWKWPLKTRDLGGFQATKVPEIAYLFSFSAVCGLILSLVKRRNHHVWHLKRENLSMKAKEKTKWFI